MSRFRLEGEELLRDGVAVARGGSAVFQFLLMSDEVSSEEAGALLAVAVETFPELAQLRPEAPCST